MEQLGADKADPGASRHGNFMNYYQFHSAKERVLQLPRAVLRRPASSRRKFIALDVGCNAGVRISRCVMHVEWQGFRRPLGLAGVVLRGVWMTVKVQWRHGKFVSSGVFDLIIMNFPKIQYSNSIHVISTRRFGRFLGSGRTFLWGFLSYKLDNLTIFWSFKNLFGVPGAVLVIQTLFLSLRCKNDLSR